MYKKILILLALFIFSANSAFACTLTVNPSSIPVNKSTLVTFTGDGLDNIQDNNQQIVLSQGYFSGASTNPAWCTDMNLNDVSNTTTSFFDGSCGGTPPFDLFHRPITPTAQTDFTATYTDNLTSTSCSTNIHVLSALAGLTLDSGTQNGIKNSFSSAGGILIKNFGSVFFTLLPVIAIFTLVNFAIWFIRRRALNNDFDALSQEWEAEADKPRDQQDRQKMDWLGEKMHEINEELG